MTRSSNCSSSRLAAIAVIGFIACDPSTDRFSHIDSPDLRGAPKDGGAAKDSSIHDLSSGSMDLAHVPDAAMSLPDLKSLPDLQSPPDLTTLPDLVQANTHLTLGAFHGDNGNSEYFNLVLWNMVGKPGQLCIPRQDGPCTILDCLNPQATGPDLLPYDSAADVGSVKITDGVTPIKLTKIGQLYDRKSQDPSQYNPGDVLTVTALGGADVPAFTAQVTLPSTMTVLSPNPARAIANGITVPVTTKYTATWQPTTGTVTITFGQSSIANWTWPDFREVHCHYDAMAGSGTVPATVMALLDPFNGNNGYGLVGHAQLDSVTAGKYVIDLESITYQIWDVTFQ